MTRVTPNHAYTIVFTYRPTTGKQPSLTTALKIDIKSDNILLRFLLSHLIKTHFISPKSNFLCNLYYLILIYTPIFYIITIETQLYIQVFIMFEVWIFIIFL